MKPFKRVVWAVYCASCKAEMPGERWPSHYRTREHREALKRAVRHPEEAPE